VKEPGLDVAAVVLYHGTMPGHADTLEQIRRLNPGLHWKKVEAYLKHVGAEVYEGSGSTVTFVLDGRKLTVDRPHPRRECGIGLVKRVRSYLGSVGHL
jgi:predicted RNA binding protein YcfA (HicA-like mRNA interferase family)